MGESSVQNLNGKIYGNKFFRLILGFCSPRKFWAAYGYWFCLIFYTLYHRSSLVGPEVSFSEKLCPFDWGCSDNVHLFFFTLPFFFLVLIFICIWNTCNKNYTFLSAAILHLLLIVFFTDGVNEAADRFVWIFGR